MTLKLKNYRDICKNFNNVLKQHLFKPSDTNRKHILKKIDENNDKYIEEINDLGISRGKEFICYPNYKKSFDKINSKILDLVKINGGNEIILTKPKEINKYTNIDWDIVKNAIF